MIVVKFKKKDNLYMSFEIKGHANSGKYGEDVVCAAISSVSTMTLNGILEVLNLEIKYKYEEGYIYCDLNNHVNNLELQNLIKIMYLFIESVANEYPKNVKIDLEEV